MQGTDYGEKHTCFAHIFPLGYTHFVAHIGVLYAAQLVPSGLLRLFKAYWPVKADLFPYDVNVLRV